MRVFGLLITKGDHAAFGDWCRDQLPLYEAVVCLDGSETDETACQAEQYRDRLIYRHEREFNIPSKSDHGLRRVVHDEIVNRFGHDQWIMCCHTDEFCYHDPRKIAAKADAEGYDQVWWFTPHFYPHPSEIADLRERMRRPLQKRYCYYHWGYLGTDRPWLEHRLYKSGRHVAWDAVTHGSVSPHGLTRPAPYHPIFRHFKVCDLNLVDFETGQPTTLYHQHWQDQPQEYRTGLPFRVERLEDLFVTQVHKYSYCTRFDGRFDQTWNMGDEYCPYPPQVF